MTALAPGACCAEELAFPWLTADDLCIGWDDGVPGEVRDASTCTRGQAIAGFLSEAGCAFTEVRCVVRYVLLCTLRDIWEGPGRDRWADGLQLESWGKLSLKDAFAQTPADPPPGWRPDEGMPCWYVCRPEHPRAIRVWMLEQRGDERIPDTPGRERNRTAAS